jgi:hypothetical protein
MAINKAPMRVGVFDAGYSRQGYIEVATGTCDVCKEQNVPVLQIDSSEDEYGAGSICRWCAYTAFNRYLAQGSE